jgi:hypothetical protein
MNMDASKWRNNLLRKMKTSRAATLKLFDQVNARMMIKPATQGKWSIKDVFAHIVAWENEGCKRLDLILNGNGNKVYYFDDMGVTNRFNARAVSKYKKVSMNTLLREAAKIRATLIERIKKLPASEINNPDHPWKVSYWLPEFAVTHEADHRDRIKKLISERKKVSRTR